jgi:hypothetical protein
MDETINKAFPPLGKSASVDEDMMWNVLVHCGLIMFRLGSGYSVLMQQWQSFLLEYQLSDTKVTHFTIAKKKYIFLRLGSWNSIKLNGVDCPALMSKAKSIIPEIGAVLHAIEHPHRCSSQTIEQRCKIYRDTLVTLNFIASTIRIKQGQLKDADLHELRRSIASLDYLWTIAGLSFTPKIHGVLAHASDQVELIEGIGDLLEDDLEHLHQMSQKISYRTGRIKMPFNKPCPTQKWKLK